MGKKKFNVVVMHTTKPNIHSHEWTHWAEGLSVIIRKGGITLTLDSDEIQKVVKALPRTFGGEY